MQNIHDQARELAAAIRNSSEYQSYIAAKERASENAELTNAINDFRSKQLELQKRQMLGETIGPEAMSHAQGLSAILMRDPLAAEYLQAEMRFTLLVNDIYSILSEAVKSE
jgi:cell fate (sporulation/competence/biofilm development) regulator YlbF (YheA/YmcA/DUF963 family)